MEVSVKLVRVFSGWSLVFEALRAGGGNVTILENTCASGLH